MTGRGQGGRTLDEEPILQGELNYIVQTAFQANEDRACVSSFYLVAVGSLVAAVFSTQLAGQEIEPRVVAAVFAALFFVLTVLGTLTTLQLARLRAAWHDSVLAMNQLKEYWLGRSGDKEIRKAFRWDTSTIPPRYKINSISYYLLLEVALLSGLTFGTAVYFFQQAVGYTCPGCNWAYAISTGVLALFIQLFIYKRAIGGEHAA